MSLSRTLRIMSALMVLVAAVPLYLSEEISLVVWALFLLGLVVSTWVGGRPFPKPVVQLLTGVLILGFLFLVFSSVQTGDWLRNAIVFALMATVARGLQVRTSRQFFQFIGLSFLLLIASAVTNPDVYFAFIFLIYAVLLTWALTYTHILEKTERAGAKPGLHWRASRFVSRRFLLGSSLLAIALLMSSMVIFFLFPRLGLGFFSAQTRRGQSIAGFSDTIELGHFGNLEDSGRVVLRVEVSGDPEYLPPPAAMRFRGMAFDEYLDGKWRASSTDSIGFRNDADGFYLIWQYDFLEKVTHRNVQYDIYQEPLETENRVLFGLDKMLRIRPLSARFDRFRGRGQRFRQDLLGNITAHGSSKSSVTYTVESGIPFYDANVLRALPWEAPRNVWSKYLQLPLDFDERIRELAKTAAGDADNPYDIAQKVETYLKSNYRYTTQGVGEVEDPIANFLFERRAGHCEYYASSMVLMLRSLKVPARPVNGFLGATYNQFGEYYTVTEDGAHSWVEVYFPEVGWVPFDPTPPVESMRGGGGFWAQMDQWLDALKLQWYKWMVEYDLEKQLSVYAGLINALSPKNADVKLSPEMSMGEFRQEMKKMGKNLFSMRTVSIVLGVFAGLVFLPWLVRRFRRRKSKERRSDLDKLAHRLRVLLRKRGVEVRQGSTLPQLARLAGAGGFTQFDVLQEVVDRLEEARWSPPDNPVDVSQLFPLLRRVKKGKIVRKG